MTIPQLIDALVEFIEQNTRDYKFRSNEQSLDKLAPLVYAGFLPRDQVGAIIPGEISQYPAIIVNVRQGSQTWESETVETEILIGCFDDERDQQGYRDVTNIVQRLRDRFREQSIVRERFPIRMPLKWIVNRFYGGGTTNYYPYFFGELTLYFELPVMAPQYDVGLLDGEATPGRLNQTPIPTPKAISSNLARDESGNLWIRHG